MEISRLEAELFHSDGRRDITNLIVTILNFENVPKNPCSVPKEDQVNRLSMDLYSAAWSAVLKLTAFRWRQ